LYGSHVVWSILVEMMPDLKREWQEGGELTYDDFIVGDFYSNSSEGGKFKFVGKDESGRLRFEDSKGINRIFSPKRMNKYADGGMMSKGGEIAEYRVIPNKRGQGSLSHIVEADYKMAFTIKGSKQEAEMSAQSFVTENNETHPTATVTKIHPSGQPLKNKKVSYVTKNEISKFAEGGHIVEHDKMYNFLEDDLQNLQNAIEEGDFEEVNRFFSYWGQHLKSLETKTNERMYNFLEDDLKKLQTAIEEGDTEEVSKFFSYWNQHLQSLKMADGGQIDEDELHELARLVMKSIDYTVNISLDEFIDEVSMTGYQRELCKYVLKMFDSHEFSKGGRVALNWNGRRKTKETWGQENLYPKYDNYYNLIADVSDYFKELGKDLDKQYSDEAKNLMIEVLKTGKITSNDGSTLSFAKGGAIENQYEGRTAEDIWNNLTEHQRMHFLVDHRRSIIGNDPKEPYYENSNKNWNDLDFEVSQGFVGHLIGGQYAKGGMMADGGAIKGSNPSTGEKFGVVIGSFEKNDDGLTTLTIRSSYSARIKSYELTFDERGFLRSIGDFGHTIDGTYPDMKGGHLSVKNVNADNKKESIDALAKITSPSFAKKVYEYVHEEKMAKGGKTDDNKWEYTDKDEIEYVVVKDKSKKEIKFDGKDVISGVHDLLEKGGKLTEIGKYYSKNDVVSVFVNGKNILDKNTVSGVWIKKDAKPMAGGGFVVVSENDGYWYIMSKPTSKQVAEEFLSTLTIPRGEVGKVVSVEDAKNHKKVIGRKYLKMADGGDVSEMKIGQTTVRKGFNGWVGKTMVDNFKGYDWDITTIKNSRGDLTTTAQGGKSEDKGGYKMFTFMLYQDPSVRLQTSRPARVNEKVVSEQHAEALKVFKEKVGNTPDKEKMADGGAIGFDALAKKVAKNYEGDEVKKQYQDEYGKTYDKKEAEEVGKKVAGKVYGQQQAKKKMAKGGKVAKKSGSPANRSQSKMTLISRKASEIRKANEPWKDAFNRAKAIIG
jgi:hypothetical protein